MHIGTHDTSSRVFVIAEAGVNHDGDLDKARALIDVAAKAGQAAKEAAKDEAKSQSRPERTDVGQNIGI